MSYELKKRGPRHIPLSLRLRRVVHVTLTDADYLELLEEANRLYMQISPWIRMLIKHELNRVADGYDYDDDDDGDDDGDGYDIATDNDGEI